MRRPTEPRIRRDTRAAILDAAIAPIGRVARQMPPYVARTQKLARTMAGFFAPPSRLRLALNNLLFNLARLPGLAPPLPGATFRDEMALPAYPA